MEFSEYSKNIRKVHSKRNTQIKDCFSPLKIYKLYSNPYKITAPQFSNIIKNIHLKFAELLSKGSDIILPERLGSIEIRKYYTSIEYKEGKLKTNLPIDWAATLKLWHEDKEAEKNKTIVRINEDCTFSIYYNKLKAMYTNKFYYRFTASRVLKKLVRESIKNNNIDAFLLKPKIYER